MKDFPIISYLNVQWNNSCTTRCQSDQHHTHRLQRIQPTNRSGYNIQAFSKQQTVRVGTYDFSRSGPDLSLLKAFSITLQIHGLCLYTALSDCLCSVVLGVHFQKQFFLLCKSTICLLQKTEKLQGAKNRRKNYHISTFLKKKITCWLTLFPLQYSLNFYH